MAGGRDYSGASIGSSGTKEMEFCRLVCMPSGGRRDTRPGAAYRKGLAVSFVASREVSPSEVHAGFAVGSRKLGAIDFEAM